MLEYRPAILSELCFHNFDSDNKFFPSEWNSTQHLFPFEKFILFWFDFPID